MLIFEMFLFWSWFDHHANHRLMQQRTCACLASLKPGCKEIRPHRTRTSENLLPLHRETIIPHFIEIKDKSTSANDDSI